jgi:hypothetical protein
MRVATKYCGGCNPQYDRLVIVRRLLEDFPEVDLVRVGEAEADVVAVVCGCHVACASHACLHGKLGKVVMTQAADYEMLQHLLSPSSITEDNAYGLES